MLRLLALLLVSLLSVAIPRLALGRANPVSATVTVSPTTVRPGEAATVTVKTTIAAPYHIYSVVKVPDPGPLATTLSFEPETLKPEGPLGETAAHVVFDKGFEKNVGVHEGEATFTQAIRIPADAKPGPLEITANLRSQACDVRGCLNPKTLHLATTLTVEAGAVRPEYASPPKVDPPTLSESPSSTPSAVPEPSAPQDQGWGAFLALAFGGGLLTLLTPCVFPMIPVTLAFFTKQATKPDSTDADRAGIVKLAVAYAAGIVVTFTAMGVVMAAVVKNASAARNFAINPWVNVVFTVLFVVFGLALLDLFELRLPSRLQNLAGKRASGTLGVLGMGLTFVVSAFTCTAPIVGSLLVVAAKATSAAAFLKPVVGMATFSFALSLPFLLLALFPSLLARLPKSGSWMTTVKGAMGFLELAAAVKFLSTADLYWNWQILTMPLFLALWAGILIAGGAWLLGIFQLGYGTPSGKITPARGISAGLFIGLGVYCLYGVTGWPLARGIAQFLPPPANEYGPTARKGALDLSFFATLEEGKKAAKASGQRVFAEFTGHTCSNCRDVEQHVMTIPSVRAQLERYARVRLYTDAGEHETAEQAEKNDLYRQDTVGDGALPLYIVIEPDGTVIGKTDYSVSQSADRFEAWLKEHAAP